jgi:hypothetical protein
MLEILRKSPVLRLEGNKTVSLKNVRPLRHSHCQPRPWFRTAQRSRSHLSLGLKTEPSAKALPENAPYEIKFPRVEGYTQAIRNRVTMDRRQRHNLGTTSKPVRCLRDFHTGFDA